MKKSLMVLCVAGVAALWANTPPVITNVQASQRTDTKLVDIYYDAADADGDALNIRIEVSDNDGVKYAVPALTLSGDIGEGVTPGTNKHIVWDAGTDWDGEYSDKMRVKIYAIDAQGFPGMEWGDEVPPGGFLMGQDGGAEGSGPSRHVNITWSYWLGKYEVTAEQYCEFLNAAYTAGNVSLDGTTYVRSNGSDTFEGYCNAGVALCKIGDDQTIRWNVNKFECTNDKTNYPAIVSYCGAMAFARFYGYDLPTEAEWEKAVRGPDNDDQDEHLLYPWGDTISSAYANTSSTLKPVGYYNGNQTPVGPDTVNGYGLYDVIGNACEWMRSSYLDTAVDYPQQESLLATFNWPFRYCYTVSDARVVRGRYDDAIYKRNAYSGQAYWNGFRVVRRHEASDVITHVDKTISFEWTQVSSVYETDCYATGPSSASGSFAMTNGANGTKAVICTTTGNDYCSLKFLLTAQRVCYFTAKVKNTSSVDRTFYLKFYSYDSDTSTSSSSWSSNEITLPANMSEFKTVSFDGAPAIYSLYIYMTSGVIVDDLEFHTVAE